METRARIVEAAARVFARRGFGQATVQDIAGEAEISMGALYHHFASKEELFRAIMEDHVRRELMEYEPQPAASAREAIEHFVAYMIDHLRKDHDSRGLGMELWAQATREAWAREIGVAAMRVFRDLLSRLLVIAQEAGVARRDLDIESAVLLIEATFVGLEVQWTLEPNLGDLDRIAKTWADLLERFVRAETEGDVGGLEDRVSRMFQELREGESASS
jgi:TetR/AcrR family acrAB operon transcriptional repressor